MWGACVLDAEWMFIRAASCVPERAEVSASVAARCPLYVEDGPWLGEWTRRCARRGRVPASPRPWVMAGRADPSLRAPREGVETPESEMCPTRPQPDDVDERQKGGMMPLRALRSAPAAAG